jgi:hypothetical protein
MAWAKQCGWLILGALLACGWASAQSRSSQAPAAWYYIREEKIELQPKALGRKAKPLTLGRGTLAPVLRTEMRKGRRRALLRLDDLATLDPVAGWVDAEAAEILPLERFPLDEELLRQLRAAVPAGPSAPRVTVRRWLVKQRHAEAALVCFLASTGMPVARLVAFLPAGGSWRRGPELEFPFSDMKPGIVFGEVRDLLGDGDECLITHEPFREGPATLGVNLVIRRLEDGRFSSLWSAPLELRNLAAFPPEVQILTPAEKNAGAPGTVTRAEVEFQARGKICVPVWKATIEFYAPAADQPLDSVQARKECAWDGARFEPVK